MFGIMVGKLYVGGYSPVYNLITYVGKTQAKRFSTGGDAEDFCLRYDIEGFTIEKF